MTKNHYFFKIGEGNYIFKYFLNKGIEPYLIIGHGDWKVKDYKKDKPKEDRLADYLESCPEDKEAKQAKSQINDFFESLEDRENSYFWVFEGQKIYVLRACNDSPAIDFEGLDKNFKENIRDELEKKNYTKIQDGKFHLWKNAKLCKARIIAEFKAYEIIHKFASINAHQGYNRRTIAKINNEAKIADALLNYKLKKEFLSPPSSHIEYLSPLQLETLVFLIMYERGFMPSCYRGGTGKNYDILLTKNDGKEEKLKGVKYISVKLNQGSISIPQINKDGEVSEDKTAYIFAIDDQKEMPEMTYNITDFYNDDFLTNDQKSKVDGWLKEQFKMLPFQIPISK